MKIMDEAIKLGSCSKMEQVTDLRSAAKMFFTPQGREFCLVHNFPDLKTFRSYKGLDKFSIFVDEHDIEAENKDIALIHSHGDLIFTEGYHVVILMHGATATIHKGQYAAVTVEGEGATWLEI